MEAPAPTVDAPSDPCPHCGQPVGDAWIVCAWCGTQIAAPAELAIGSTLADGRYEVLGIIGRGGFGITYEAADTRLERRVAVKELFPESAVRHGSMVLTPPHARAAFRSSRERFLREARVLARFTHPGIVRVYEVFEEHGTAYLVMELLGGRTLVDVLRTRGEPFTEAEVLDVAGRVAAALRPVHAAGVLHRDVNPSNVMLTEHGRIVVIDFGLARDFDQHQTMGMTRMVTPGYAPLEQYRGEGRFGPSTDVYGLAATCYRLATGRVPVAAVERDAGADLPSPTRLNAAISKPVSDAILDGLELEPGHRPQDLDSFLARLGVRHLPDAPRSILLGTVGAQAADLLSAAPLPAPPVEPPEPRTDLADPGPALARPEVEPAPAGTEVVGTVPPPASAALTGAWSGRVVDPDRTEADPAAPIRTAVADPDRTWMPDAPVAGVADPDRTLGPDRTVGPDQPQSPVSWEAAPFTAPPSPGAIAKAGRSSRRKVLVPLGIVAVALGSVAPVIVGLAVVLLVLPALATLGDWSERRAGASAGLDGRRSSRSSSVVWLPWRFGRNVLAAVLRSSPIIGVAVIVLAGWYAGSEAGLPDGLLDVTLRLIGGGVVAILLLMSREGSPRFRSGRGMDELAQRGAPGGRTTERLVVSWLVMAIVTAGALLLAPSAFPLP